MKIISLIKLFTASAALFAAAGSNAAEAPRSLRVGVAPGPYGELFTKTIAPGIEKLGYKWKVVQFQDYVQPDLALENKATAGKLAFAGNLNPVAIMQNETPEGVRAAAFASYERAGREPGYMLMPGCDIPTTTPLENIRTLLDVARNLPTRN